MPEWVLRILETPEDMAAVEDLQRAVWVGSETEVVPTHLLMAMVHNGGLAVGAWEVGSGQGGAAASAQFLASLEKSVNLPPIPARRLVGFVFGFPGLYPTPDGPRLKHCSHMLAVHPEVRTQGLGFSLKRAQWQMIRHQGLDRITWTFDPLLSRNAYLNIARLGAVCNTYLPNEYGVMRDGMNTGLPSDRFQVDWWINSQRVARRLSKKPRLQLDLAHFLAAETTILNPTRIDERGLPHPGSGQASQAPPDPPQRDEGDLPDPSAAQAVERLRAASQEEDREAILLVEIPADFLALKAEDFNLALEWRLHSRALFEAAFSLGYLVTDFVHLPGTHARSFYVLSHGDSTLS